MSHSLTPSPTAGYAPEDEEEDSSLDYFYDEPGTLPGTLDLEPDDPAPEIVLIDYNLAKATRVKLDQPQDFLPYLTAQTVSWLDIQGLGNTETWRQMSQIFQFHPLALEDVVNVPQRPKVVYYENPDQIVIVAWMVLLKPDSRTLHREQVSLILGENYLITVQEEPQYDCLEAVRDRIRNNQGSIRKHGADYLAYAILDAIIDGFFPVLEHYTDRLEELEDEVLFKPSNHTLWQIYEVKQELLVLRRAIWSQRDAINILVRDRTRLISKRVRVYLRDCYDHTINIRDMLETNRELSSDLINIYMSTMGNKMNEIMKILTVISTIFIPLTFIAGVYGMNFNPEASPWNMPELNWYWGYPVCLAVMLAIGVSLFVFFWKRGWFEDFSELKQKK
ncbi:magnesium/cobalt transporter CorA [Capilliphycus salinus ALCB114379]|uniref:magnesium/cobalt transporter CorA n=1 Tax=Capilliphycus salinus TaxID=2768948 RepID=UPI0039A4B1A3